MFDSLQNMPDEAGAEVANSFAEAVAHAQQALSDLCTVREQIVETENKLAYLQTQAALLLAQHRHFAKELETHL